jgi:hypothetical protein
MSLLTAVVTASTTDQKLVLKPSLIAGAAGVELLGGILGSRPGCGQLEVAYATKDLETKGKNLAIAICELAPQTLLQDGVRASKGPFGTPGGVHWR